jgi:hypothetical protein
MIAASRTQSHRVDAYLTTMTIVSNSVLITLSLDKSAGYQHRAKHRRSRPKKRTDSGATPIQLKITIEMRTYLRTKNTIEHTIDNTIENMIEKGVKMEPSTQSTLALRDKGSATFEETLSESSLFWKDGNQTSKDTPRLHEPTWADSF